MTKSWITNNNISNHNLTLFNKKCIQQLKLISLEAINQNNSTIVGLFIYTCIYNMFLILFL